MVALPTPAGPDTSTPRLAVAPRVSSSCGSSRASLSHSVSLPAWAWAPLRSSKRDRRDGCLSAIAPVAGAAAADAVGRRRSAVAPADDRVGLHADRAGRIDAADREQFRGPGDADRGRQRCAGRRRRGAGAEIAGQQRHRVADRHHLAEQRLSQRRRRTPTRWPASNPSPSPTARRTPSPARRSRWRPRAGRRWTASRRRAERCPRGRVGPATPTTAAVVREPVSDTASHSRMPSAAMASGCRRTTPRRVSSAEVLSRAVSVSDSAGSRRPTVVPSRSCRGPGRASRAGTVCGWAPRRMARRLPRCWAWRPTPPACAATQRWLRTVNGMMAQVADDDQQDQDVGEQQQPGRGDRDQDQQDRRGVRRHRDRLQRQVGTRLTSSAAFAASHTQTNQCDVHQPSPNCIMATSGPIAPTAPHGAGMPVKNSRV